MMGRLQFWLQGHPNKYRPWAIVWVGNLISDLRYRWWRARGGRHEQAQSFGEFYVADYSQPNATSSFTVAKGSTDAQNTGGRPDDA